MKLCAHCQASNPNDAATCCACGECSFFAGGEERHPEQRPPAPPAPEVVAETGDDAPKKGKRARG